MLTRPFRHEFASRSLRVSSGTGDSTGNLALKTAPTALRKQAHWHTNVTTQTQNTNTNHKPQTQSTSTNHKHKHTVHIHTKHKSVSLRALGSAAKSSISRPTTDRLHVSRCTRPLVLLEYSREERHTSTRIRICRKPCGRQQKVSINRPTADQLRPSRCMRSLGELPDITYRPNNQSTFTVVSRCMYSLGELLQDYTPSRHQSTSSFTTHALKS